MELDDRIVERLVAAGAKATFFVSGRWAEAVPDGVRRLAQEPSSEIGNHSHRHRHLRGLGDAAIRADLAATQELLADQTGHRPRWFRPPFGEVDARIARAAAAVGLGTVQFDVASGDPGRGLTKAALVRTVVGRASAGSIVVMHANHRRFATADAMDRVEPGP